MYTPFVTTSISHCQTPFSCYVKVNHFTSHSKGLFVCFSGKVVMMLIRYNGEGTMMTLMFSLMTLSMMTMMMLMLTMMLILIIMTVTMMMMMMMMRILIWQWRQSTSDVSVMRRKLRNGCKPI